MICEDTQDVLSEGAMTGGGEPHAAEERSVLARVAVPIIYLIVVLLLGMTLSALVLPQLS